MKLFLCSGWSGLRSPRRPLRCQRKGAPREAPCNHEKLLLRCCGALLAAVRRVMSDDFAAYLIIRSLGQYLLSQKVALAVVRTAINDLLAVSVANSWKRCELILGRRIDVN